MSARVENKTLADFLQSREEATKAKYGDKIKCACCLKEITKNSYHKIFCGAQCRKKYWNIVRFPGWSKDSYEDECWPDVHPFSDEAVSGDW